MATVLLLTLFILLLTLFSSFNYYCSCVATVFVLPQAQPHIGGGGQEQEQMRGDGGRGEGGSRGGGVVGGLGLEAWRPVAADMLPLMTMHHFLKSPLYADIMQ